jgi:Zn-dependent protease with chaperone function
LDQDGNNMPGLTSSSRSGIEAIRSWRRHGQLFELAALTSLVAVFVSFAVPVWLFFGWLPDEQRSVNRLLDACQQGVRRGSFAAVGYAAGGLLLAWAAIVSARLMWRGARDLVRIYRQGRALSALADEVEFCVAGAPLAVRLLAADSALAFTAGLVRPRVYVGRALLRGLSAAELEATLLHEAAHANRRDPLRCWLVELVISSLSFPGTSWLGAAHRAAREAQADARAVRRLGDDRPLLRSLSKVDALSPAPGLSSLTGERERALRQVRNHGLVGGARERAGLLLGLTVVVALLVLATTGLSDWQSYWFCPEGTSIQA